MYGKQLNNLTNHMLAIFNYINNISLPYLIVKKKKNPARNVLAWTHSISLI